MTKFVKGPDNEAMNMEKVIKELHDARRYLEDKEWSDRGASPHIDAINDALALLKDQKHGETFTVIDTKTGKEADEYEIALHEDWAKHLCYCDMEGWAIENDGTLLLVDECGRFAYADRERFTVVWDA